MAELKPEELDEFFAALWSTPEQPKRPFQWQRDLMRRVLADDAAPWPEAIALPTASGKTACIDIALFALAAQADRLDGGTVITAPRRIFFAVDRRVIVDEAYDRARRIARRLREAESGVLRKVADNLRRIAHGEAAGCEAARPLAVHLLRGGMYRSEAWAHDPLQPTIVATTVDQLGSRLLFRAYGRGPGMLPVYAGLIANDSLILLDEAHCAQPFLQTLKAVERYRSWAGQPLGRRFHPVVMSATPPATITDRFEDSSEEPRDETHPLGRRQLAKKPVTLHEVTKAKGARAIPELAHALAAQAEALAGGEPRAVVVFVNRVATARKVSELLKSRHRGKVTLVTGRMRPIDKQEILDAELKPLASSCSEGRRLEAAHFVVATQTLEVGADLDFDALVTECASLDALRQRFGRLNRMGREIPAAAAILVRADQAAQSEEDPVYGAALADTWNWLKTQEAEHGNVDFGIAALAARLPAAELLGRLTAPSGDAPVLAPIHIDLWAQTSPQPTPSPEVANFLHGERRSPADVQVCWRADLDLTDEAGRAAALESLSLCPPSSAESLPVPISAFRRWMRGTPGVDDSPDVEGAAAAAAAAEEETDEEARPRRVLLWRAGEAVHTEDPLQVRPGEVVVLPLLEGAPDANRLGDLPAVAAPVLLDVGDRAHRMARAKALLRLYPAQVAAWPEGEAKAAAEELFSAFAEGQLEAADLRERLSALLALLARPEPPPPERWGWLAQAAEGLGSHFAIKPVGRRELVLVGSKPLPAMGGDPQRFSDEDDAAASGLARPGGGPVPLAEHLAGVAGFARRFARGCGLPAPLAEAVECAGRLHDLGKADPRFQAYLRGGSRWLAGEPLAKSGAMPKGLKALAAARKAAGYPDEARHELLSVRLAESAPALLPADTDLAELVLHLIASHHGHCRPFAPPVPEEAEQATEWNFDGRPVAWRGPTRLERLDSGVSDRFWRLSLRYGWWGLAWLEALVRLADHRRSEWEERGDDGV